MTQAAKHLLPNLHFDIKEFMQVVASQMYGFLMLLKPQTKGILYSVNIQYLRICKHSIKQRNVEKFLYLKAICL